MNAGHLKLEGSSGPTPCCFQDYTKLKVRAVQTLNSGQPGYVPYLHCTSIQNYFSTALCRAQKAPNIDSRDRNFVARAQKPCPFLILIVFFPTCTQMMDISKIYTINIQLSSDVLKNPITLRTF